MSSIVGFLAPVKRSSPYGRRVIFARRDSAPTLLMAPIAPGLIEPVGVERIETIDLDKPMPLTVSAGSIALDGEREVTFSEVDSISVTLRNAAFHHDRYRRVHGTCGCAASSNRSANKKIVSREDVNERERISAEQGQTARSL